MWTSSSSHLGWLAAEGVDRGADRGVFVGGDRLAMRNGTVRYWNCPNACDDQVSPAAGGGRYGRKWSATMPAMALAS
jgi:hypothetical protein